MEATLEAMVNGTKSPFPAHPYYPVEAEIMGYIANEYSVVQLLAAFAAGCTTILSVTYAAAKRIRPQIPTSELLTVMWFVLSGCIHFFFEGYFAYNFRSMGERQDLFGQLWKEYAYSDSRYLTQNAFVMCMESITAVCWGPLAFIVAHTITTEHPLRHPLQAIVSLGQLYGDVLYYATSMFDHYYYDRSYWRPEAYYYWCYYVLMNMFWIVIPLVLLYKSTVASGRAFKALQKMDRSLKANGTTKKTL